MDDSLIIDLFWQRSEDVLTVCADRFGAYCRKIAINVLCSNEDADECVNETWLKAWNAIPPAKPTSLRAFLGRITRNIAINHYNAAHAEKRGGALEAVRIELAQIPSPQADDGEITLAINNFLYAEQKHCADIFIKRYWYLESIKDIAAEYGWGENRVVSLLFRMRGRLKSKLESEGLL